jgi:peroxiredoxin Q/BCP
MYNVADKAFAFNLPDKDNKLHSLADVKTKYTIVFFYPKDDTPGCTLESKDFELYNKDFKAKDATVIGVSGGDAKSKSLFCKKAGLTIPILSDTNFSVCKEYGVYGEKSFMGKKYMGIFRTTFVLDKAKKVLKIYKDVTPKEHAKTVLHEL